MQTHGSLQETDLASLLKQMQTERATGTLSLEAGHESCSLFVLFGHLFHATSPDGDGEPAVLRALSWTRGEYRFQRRAKLPAKETVTSSPAELIASAQEAQRAATAAAGLVSAAPKLHTMEGQAESIGDDGGASMSDTPIRQSRSGWREPPLFPPSPSRTARRSRR